LLLRSLLELSLQGINDVQLSGSLEHNILLTRRLAISHRLYGRPICRGFLRQWLWFVLHWRELKRRFLPWVAELDVRPATDQEGESNNKVNSNWQ